MSAIRSLRCKPDIEQAAFSALDLKRNESNVLVVGSYSGSGATKEQFKNTMNVKGIDVVFASELDT